MQILFFGLALSLVLSCQEPDVVCAGASYTVELQFDFKHEELFTEKKLTQYFQTVSEYPHYRSAVIMLSADTEFIKQIKTPRAGSSEKPPDIISSPAPQARLWKLGENAFFEYRDRMGRIGWKTLKGQNIYSAVISGHQVVLVGESFRCTSPQRHVYHQLAFVVPDLPEMGDEEIARICLFYRDVLAPESVEVSLWASFDGVAPGFPLPTLESLAGGYTGGNYSGIATRHARYSGFTGELLVSESSTTARRLKIP